MQRKIIAKIIYVLLLVIAPSVVFALGKNDVQFFDDFVRKNWDTADGLPGMTITSLMQDNKG